MLLIVFERKILNMKMTVGLYPHTKTQVNTHVYIFTLYINTKGYMHFCYLSISDVKADHTALDNK